MSPQRHLGHQRGQRRNHLGVRLKKVAWLIPFFQIIWAIGTPTLDGPQGRHDLRFGELRTAHDFFISTVKV